MDAVDPLNSTSSFLPTTKNFFVDEEQLRIILTRMYSDIVFSMNLKEIGSYEQIELYSGKQFFMPGTAQLKRYVYRKSFVFGAIASGATSTQAHGIAQLSSFTSIYGTCVTDIIDYRPIPYSSETTTTNIELLVDATNITMINGSTAPNITSALVILEYFKQ